MKTNDDLYARLGVPDDVDVDTLRKAWRATARRSHPDAGGDRNEFEAALRAYQTLSDPHLRARYDREREADNNAVGRLATDIRTLEQLCRTLAARRETADVETLVDLTDKLTAAHIRLRDLYVELSDVCERAGIAMFDPRTGTPDHRTTSGVTSPPQGSDQTHDGTWPRGWQQPPSTDAPSDDGMASPVYRFADGERVVFSDRNRHGIAVPTVEQSRSYRIAPRWVLERVKEHDRWFRIPAPTRLRWQATTAVTGPRWLRTNPLTAAMLAGAATAIGTGARTVVDWPDHETWAGQVIRWDQPFLVMAVFTVLLLTWPARLLLAAMSRTSRSAYGATVGLVVATLATTPGPWVVTTLSAAAGATVGATAGMAGTRLQRRAGRRAAPETQPDTEQG